MHDPDSNKSKKVPKLIEKQEIKLVETITLRPAFIDEYIEARNKKNEWKKKEEQLVGEVKEFLKANPGGFKDIYIAKTTKKPKYDPIKLWDFISHRVPHAKVDEITIRTIDESRLTELYLQGYFSLQDLQGCYELVEGNERIEIPENRRRKKDEG